jgi:TrpR family trp operon transcriptional repressor
MSMEEYKKEINTLIKKVAGSGGSLLNEFLDDLLTAGEYEEIARRWQIVKMLESGIPQREIAERLGVGVATVTRGAKELADKKGGFRKAITKFGTK